MLNGKWQRARGRPRQQLSLPSSFLGARALPYCPRLARRAPPLRCGFSPAGGSSTRSRCPATRSRCPAGAAGLPPPPAPSARPGRRPGRLPPSGRVNVGKKNRKKEKKKKKSEPRWRGRRGWAEGRRGRGAEERGGKGKEGGRSGGCPWDAALGGSGCQRCPATGRRVGWPWGGRWVAVGWPWGGRAVAVGRPQSRCGAVAVPAPTSEGAHGGHAPTRSAPPPRAPTAGLRCPGLLRAQLGGQRGCKAPGQPRARLRPAAHRRPSQHQGPAKVWRVHVRAYSACVRVFVRAGVRRLWWISPF